MYGFTIMMSSGKWTYIDPSNKKYTQKRGILVCAAEKNVQNELWKKNLQEQSFTKRDRKTSWIGIKLSRREILDSQMNGRKWEWLYFIHEKLVKPQTALKATQ